MKDSADFLIGGLLFLIIILAIIVIANQTNASIDCLKASTNVTLVETVLLDCTVTPNCFITSDTLMKKLEVDIEKRTACPNETE